MIITKLMGGLGNQMFQYAAGLRLALIQNTDLKVDITDYNTDKGDTKRFFRLDQFNIDSSIATESELNSFKNPSASKITRTINKLLGIKKTIVKEKKFTFDPEILSAPNNSYVDGFWQSEKYFADRKKDVIRNFTLKQNLQNKLDKKILDGMQSQVSVSLHIRRGDYITNPTADQVLGFIGLDYYKESMKLLESKLNNINYYIFSDDLNWVKENFTFNYPVTFVEGMKDYEDLILMSNCKHNVTANSSFSWWGAWLNSNDSKIVIAPKNWFKDTVNYSASDLIPESWTKL